MIKGLANNDDARSTNSGRAATFHRGDETTREGATDEGRTLSHFVIMSLTFLTKFATSLFATMAFVGSSDAVSSD